MFLGIFFDHTSFLSTRLIFAPPDKVDVIWSKIACETLQLY